MREFIFRIFLLCDDSVDIVVDVSVDVAVVSFSGLVVDDGVLDDIVDKEMLSPPILRSVWSMFRSL